MHSHDCGSHLVKCDSYCFTGFWDMAVNGKTHTHTHTHTESRFYRKTNKNHTVQGREGCGNSWRSGAVGRSLQLWGKARHAFNPRFKDAEQESTEEDVQTPMTSKQCTWQRFGQARVLNQNQGLRKVAPESKSRGSEGAATKAFLAGIIMSTMKGAVRHTAAMTGEHEQGCRVGRV